MILCGYGDRLSGELDCPSDLPGLKLTDQCTFLNTTGDDHTIYQDIVYRLRFIKQVRNVHVHVGTSAILTSSLIQYSSNQPGFQILEVALYKVHVYIGCVRT